MTRVAHCKRAITHWEKMIAWAKDGQLHVVYNVNGQIGYRREAAL